MSQRPVWIERVAAGLLFSSLGLVAFNLAAAQILFGLAALLWLYLIVGDRAWPTLPAFAVPLLVYAALTIASAVASLDPSRSLIDLKQLVLFLMVPMVVRLAQGAWARTALDVIIATGAAGAVLGVVQYSALGFDDLGQRPQGTLTHYMTYSGVIMLVMCAAAARLVFRTNQWIWPAVAVPALGVALAFTQTRNAWIGAIAGVGVLLAVRSRRLLLVIPIVVLAALLLAPAALRDRAYSIVDTEDPSNRDRLAMLEVGAGMVRDHPLLGVGPDMVEGVYADYRPDYAVNPVNIHLHNVPVQIAAERGLPAMVAWLVFVGVAGVGLLRQVRSGPARDVAGAGLAATVAMVAAGMFEYNFGDSEFLMLFLGLISLPWAARVPRNPAGATRVPPSGAAAR